MDALEALSIAEKRMAADDEARVMITVVGRRVAG